MRPLLLKLMMLAGLAAACGGPSLLLGGEGVRTPEPPLPTVEISVLAGDDLTPVDALVTIDDAPLAADGDGILEVEWRGDPLAVTATAPGFKPGTATIEAFPEEGPFELRLDPIVLRGSVLGSNGRPLPGATVRLGADELLTDDDGEFRFRRAVGDELVITRPAWEPARIPWDGADETVVLRMEPRMIRGLRVGADKAGNPTEWRRLIELAGASGVNAFVIDTKDEVGWVYHDTGVALAHEIGAVKPLYDMSELLADMDEAGLYKITRIVTFQDNPLAKARPALAARNTRTGNTWQNNRGIRWLDPTDRDSWEYSLALAEEACRLGFDEIQFDYVRFPSDGPISALALDGLDASDYYSAEKQAIRLETVAAFLQEAKSRLNPLGCATAADIFAITLESSSDEGIGQRPQALANSVDVLSPMIYTYVYPPGWAGCENPNDCAELIVRRALDSGLTRLQGYSIYRPWLQRAFLADDDILGIQAVAEGFDLGWMLWSATTSFDLDFLPPPG